jgi:hypothetical protein
MSALSPAARAAAQLILDRAARRLLAERPPYDDDPAGNRAEVTTEATRDGQSPA